MNKLVLDGRPFVVESELACIIGLSEAIFLQQVHYIILHNKLNNINFYNGYYWVHKSYEDWKKIFPFWATQTIHKIIQTLGNTTPQLLIYNNIDDEKIIGCTIDYKALNDLLSKAHAI